MLELTIKDNVYKFKFGIGFVREIDKTKQLKAENGTMQDAGLQLAVASLIDEDPVALIDILDLANKTEKPRVTKGLLDAYIDDEDTDIDELFRTVLDFFEKTNATKKKTAMVQEMVENERAKRAAAE